MTTNVAMPDFGRNPDICCTPRILPNRRSLLRFLKINEEQFLGEIEIEYGLDARFEMESALDEPNTTIVYRVAS